MLHRSFRTVLHHLFLTGSGLVIDSAVLEGDGAAPFVGDW